MTRKRDDAPARRPRRADPVGRLLRTAERIVYESRGPILDQIVIHFSISVADLSRLVEGLREQAERSGASTIETALRLDVRSTVLEGKRPHLTGLASVVPLGTIEQE